MTGSVTNPSTIKRILRSISANSFAFMMTSMTQLIAVPVLLSKWGATTFGVWIIISSVAAYINLLDLGLSSVIGTAMAMESSDGRTAQANALFQSLWRRITVTSALCILAAIGFFIVSRMIAWDLPAAVVALIVAQSAIGLHSVVFQAGYRAAGHYPTGVMSQSLLRASCDVAVVVTALAGGDLLHAALASFVVMTIGVVSVGIYLNRTVAWLELRWTEAERDLLRPYWAMAFSTLSTPVSFALTIQAVPAIIGAVISSPAVAVFSATRTLTRIATHAAAIVNHAFMPEYAMTIRADRRISLFRTNFWFVAITGPLVFLALLFGGEQALLLWTHGRISPDRMLLIALSGAAVIQIINNFLYNTLLGANEHRRASWGLLVTAVLTVVLCYFGLRLFGLFGAGLSILVSEAGLVSILWRESTRAGFLKNRRRAL